jgi:hypothetical protein
LPRNSKVHFVDGPVLRLLECQVKGRQKRKPYLDPYTSLQDRRFQFFEELLQYFLQWKQSVQLSWIFSE